MDAHPYSMSVETRWSPCDILPPLVGEAHLSDPPQAYLTILNLGWNRTGIYWLCRVVSIWAPINLVNNKTQKLVLSSASGLEESRHTIYRSLWWLRENFRNLGNGDSLSILHFISVAILTPCIGLWLALGLAIRAAPTMTYICASYVPVPALIFRL